MANNDTSAKILTARTPHSTPNILNACKPGVKKAVRKQAVNGSGVHAISRCQGNPDKKAEKQQKYC